MRSSSVLLGGRERACPVVGEGRTKLRRNFSTPLTKLHTPQKISYRNLSYDTASVTNLSRRFSTIVFT
jgi:hypothetical protein